MDVLYCAISISYWCDIVNKDTIENISTYYVEVYLPHQSIEQDYLLINPHNVLKSTYDARN